MLTRPLTLRESDDRGRGMTAVTPPPALPLADGGDDAAQTGVFSPPAPPWSSSSSSSPASPPPPPLCASSSSSAPSLAPPPSLLSSSSFTPPPLPSPPPPTLAPLSSLSFSTPPPVSLLPPPSSVCPPPVALCTPPPPPVPPSLLSPPPPCSSPPVSPPPPVPPSLLSPPPPCSSPPVSLPPPPPVSIIHAPSSSSSSPPPSHFSPLSSSCPPSLHPPPPSLSPHSVCTPPAPPSVSSSPLPPRSLHDSPPFSSAPLPPPPVFVTPCSSAICSPLSSSSPPVPPSLLSPPPPCSSPPVSLPPPPVAPSLLPSAPPHPPCCPCSSLLPRLLSAHRLEVRRLLRGALASLGRRLDSLERRSRRKRRRKKRSRQKGGGGAACSLGAAAFPLSPASSCSPAHLPPVTTASSSSSSSSDSEDSPTPPLSSSWSQSEQSGRSRGGERRGGRRTKRRRKSQSVFPENREDDEEEEDAGRFVGRMAVSFRGRGGAEEDAPLMLHNFTPRKHRREGGGTSQSEKAVVRPNGHRVPLLHSTCSSSSQRALHLLQSAQSGRTCSQSEALTVSSGQWRFSDFSPSFSLSYNHSALCLWLCSSSFSPAPMLRLSAVAVETMSESVRGGACGSPLRPLKDWTAPSSLSSDHCYVRTPTSSPTFSARRQQKQRANHSSRSLLLPRRRALPLPPCSANGLSAPLPAGQSAAGSEFVSTNGERGKRVSQIRIRRASPRETPLTPMGLPKVKRLKKKEFSLEEIYTNKNYKSPTTNRSLETIFEEPREKDGALLLIGQQRRRRLLLFPDFTQPRKRKRPQGAGLPVATVPRKRVAARRHCHGNSPGDDDSDLDVMLVERLSALEDFLTRQGLDV